MGAAKGVKNVDFHSKDLMDPNPIYFLIIDLEYIMYNMALSPS